MIWLPCEKACEPGPNQYVWRENGDTAHERLSGDLMNDGVHVECGNCGHAYWIPAELWEEAAQQLERDAKKRRRANLTRYPRINAQLGEVVTSKEHEEHMIKAMGYHKAENGLDHRYDDEGIERIRDRYKGLAEKRKAIQKKRAALGLARR